MFLPFQVLGSAVMPEAGLAYRPSLVVLASAYTTRRLMPIELATIIADGAIVAVWISPLPRNDSSAAPLAPSTMSIFKPKRCHKSTCWA